MEREGLTASVGDVSFDGKCLGRVWKPLVRNFVFVFLQQKNDGRGRRRHEGPHVHADAMQQHTEVSLTCVCSMTRVGF